MACTINSTCSAQPFTQTPLPYKLALTLFFPSLVASDATNVRGATAAAVWAAGDRSRGTVGEVWVGTKYNRPRLTTARRRAPALSLRAAPRTSVGDVPTA